MFNFLVSLLRSGGCSAANGPSPSPGTSQIVSPSLLETQSAEGSLSPDCSSGTQSRGGFFLPEGEDAAKQVLRTSEDECSREGKESLIAAQRWEVSWHCVLGGQTQGGVKGRPAFLQPVSGRLMSSRLLPLYILVLMWTSCCASWETTCALVTSARLCVEAQPHFYCNFCVFRHACKSSFVFFFKQKVKCLKCARVAHVCVCSPLPAAC